MGWYRMSQTFFTTTHLIYEEIYRVHWLRFPLLQIQEGGSHRRIRRRARSFKVTIEQFTGIRPDHEELYGRYRASIDFDGAMSIQQCLLDDKDAGENVFPTQCISVFDQDKLIAGGYFDLGERSAASILHFFDPAYKRYSLGKYLILLTLDYLKAGDYELYYPGYIIAGNPKLDYKLFLGTGAAQYFDPATVTWMPFEDRLLNAEEYSEIDKLEVVLALLSGKPV